jgi:hypothetical protein
MSLAALVVFGVIAAQLARKEMAHGPCQLFAQTTLPRVHAW